MRVRQLEFALQELGVPASALDVVTRQLRAQKMLPVGGRGLNAPKIGPDEAAWVLIGLAGSDAAAQAAWALHKQLELRMVPGSAPRHSDEFVSVVQILLGNPDWAGEVVELRVGRSHALSQIIYRDGHVERFVGPDAPHLAAGGGMRFRTEGVIGGGMLHQIAIDLAEPNNLLGIDA